MAQRVKNLPAMQDTWVRSLGWEDPLDKGVATHSGILSWRIPWAEEPDGLQSMGSQRVGHNWVTSVQFSSVQSCPTLCNPRDCSTPGFPVHYQLLEFTQTHAHWVGDTIQPSHPLPAPSPPAFSLSQHQGLFKWVSSLHLHRWSKYWNFSFNISPSNEYSGLISFRMDLLLCKDSQESSPTPQFKSINSLALNFLYGPALTSIHDYWKNHSFGRWSFVGKVMSLLFNMLSRVVIAFLPRSKLLLISWPQSPSAVILEPPKIKSVSASIVSPSICHEVIGPDAMTLVFWMLSFKPTFSLSSFAFIKRPFSFSLSAISVVSSAYLRYFSWQSWFLSDSL